MELFLKSDPFFFKDFIYLTERDTVREGTQAGGMGERQAGFPPSRESASPFLFPPAPFPACVCSLSSFLSQINKIFLKSRSDYRYWEVGIHSTCAVTSQV